MALFIALHLKGFKFGEEYTTKIDGEEMRDLYRLVVESYQQPEIVGFYLFMMVVVGVHLRHAVWSAFQSLGLANPKWLGLIEKAGFAFAVLVSGGTQPRSRQRRQRGVARQQRGSLHGRLKCAVVDGAVSS